jgi:hypothetical protein
MATIDKNLGQIRDRTIGYKPISYYVDNKSKKYMDSCLKAHETIICTLTPQARENITPKEIKAAVLTYLCSY